MMTRSGLFYRSELASILPPVQSHGLDKASSTDTKLTPEEIAAIGDAIGKIGGAVGDVVNPKPKGSSAPAPTPSMISGVPDIVVIGAFVLILAVVLVKS